MAEGTLFILPEAIAIIDDSGLEYEGIKYSFIAAFDSSQIDEAYSKAIDLTQNVNAVITQGRYQYKIWEEVR